MNKLTIGNYNPADEFVVEAMMRDGKFKVIGKVITNNNLLNDDDLETIWDFANWGVNGYEKFVVEDGVYKGCKAFNKDGLSYIILTGEVDVVNDNVMVRKHYDITQGYYIKSARLHKELEKDVWCFGSRETIESEYKSNPFVCGK